MMVCVFPGGCMKDEGDIKQCSSPCIRDIQHIGIFESCFKIM